MRKITTRGTARGEMLIQNPLAVITLTLCRYIGNTLTRYIEKARVEIG
jgi:hypothetical protein